MVTLSKSKYMAGLRCPRLLWCHFNAPERIPPVDEETQAIFDQGHEIGDWAKKLHPGGIEIARDGDQVEATKRLLAKRVPLFEAAFAHGNGYCQVDLLIPAGKDAWDIVEVKSSTEVKEEKGHIDDVAFQRWCAEGAGLKIRKTFLMHVNNEYVRKGPIDPAQLLIAEDITEAASLKLPGIEPALQRMLAIIRRPDMPSPLYGTECKYPKECDVCLKDLPEDNVTQLYRLGQRAYPLLNEGIVRITDLPPDVKLNGKQEAQIRAIRTGKPIVDAKQIRAFLKRLVYPLYLLDFEAVQPAVPLFDGTWPYQHVPFQLSLHIIERPGAAPSHQEFLADGPDDPRPGVIGALRRIGPAGTILTYNQKFEKGVIDELAEAYPADAAWLRALHSRIDDLIIPFQNFWYYDPKQHGSCSIKAVLPALTGKRYDNLEISEGNQAAREFLAITYRGEKRKDVKKLRAALLEYCAQDTQAMIDLLHVLEDAVR